MVLSNLVPCEIQVRRTREEVNLKEKMSAGDTLHDFAEHERDNADEPYDKEMTKLFKSKILKDTITERFAFIQNDDFDNYPSLKRKIFGDNFSKYNFEKSYERQLTGLITYEQNLQPCVVTITSSEIYKLYKTPSSPKKDEIKQKIISSNGSIKIVLEDKKNMEDIQKLYIANFIKYFLHGEGLADIENIPSEIRILFDAGINRIGKLFNVKGSGGIRFYTMACTGDSAGTTINEEKLMLDPLKPIEYDDSTSWNFTSNYFTCDKYSAGYFPKEGTKFGEDGTPLGCYLKIWKKDADPETGIKYDFGPSVTTGSGVADIGKIFKRFKSENAVQKLPDFIKEMKDADHKTRLKLLTSEFVRLFGNNIIDMEKFLIDYKRAGDFEQLLSVLNKINKESGNVGNYTFCSIDIMAITCARNYGIPSIWQHDYEIELYRNDLFKGNETARAQFLKDSLTKQIANIKIELEEGNFTKTIEKIKEKIPIIEGIVEKLKTYITSLGTNPDFSKKLYQIEIQGVIICLDNFLNLYESIPVDTAPKLSPNPTTDDINSLNQEITFLKTQNDLVLQLNQFIQMNIPKIENIVANGNIGGGTFQIPVLNVDFAKNTSKNKAVVKIIKLHKIWSYSKQQVENAKETGKRQKLLECVEKTLQTNTDNLYKAIADFAQVTFMKENEKENILDNLLNDVPPNETLTITPSQPVKLPTPKLPTPKLPTPKVSPTNSTRKKSPGNSTNKQREPVREQIGTRSRTAKSQAGGGKRRKFTRKIRQKGGNVTDPRIRELLLRMYNQCNLFMKSLVPLDQRTQSYVTILQKISENPDNDVLIDNFFINLVGFINSELTLLKDDTVNYALNNEIMFLLYISGILFDKENDTDDDVNIVFKVFQRDENFFKDYVHAEFYNNVIINPNARDKTYNIFIKLLQNVRNYVPTVNCNLCIISLFAFLEYCYNVQNITTFIEPESFFTAKKGLPQQEIKKLINLTNFDSPITYMNNIMIQHLSILIPLLEIKFVPYLQTESS